MKLYDVRPGSMVKVLEPVDVPPCAPSISVGDVIHFGHIDGMYSFCHRGEELVHLAAWTEVEVVS